MTQNQSGGTEAGAPDPEADSDPGPPAPGPGILDIAAYVPGSSQVPGLNRSYKLSSNEAALGASPAAIEAYQALAGELHRYPDGGAVALRQALAAHFGIAAERIVCGDGSDELLGLLVSAYAGPGDEVLYSRHGFVVYKIAALGVGATPLTAPEQDYTADVDALLEMVNERTRIVFLSNPNCTGTYITADEVRRLHAGLPSNVLFVVDSAYAEFVGAEDYSAGLELVGAAENVVMTRTFSKAYGLAALRLGWCYGPAAVIDVLNRVRGPFNVTAPAQAAGIAALGDQEFLERARRHNDQWRPWLENEAKALGFRVIPSVANFVMVGSRDGGAADDLNRHLIGRGVLVRGMGGYGLGDFLRVSVGSEEETRAVLEALASYPASNPD